MRLIIQSPAPDLKKSVSFYKQLGFTIVETENNHLCIHGKIAIELNQAHETRPAIQLRFPSEEIAEVIEKLAPKYSLIDQIGRTLLLSPSGTLIHILEENETPSLESNQPLILGAYAGISLESLYYENSIDFWELLGFSITMGGKDQDWCALMDKNGNGLSIMKMNVCPHLFFNPSLTFFNGKENLNIIQKIRDLAIPIAQEITHFNKENIVDNIILKDPGGIGFFLFND